MEDTWASRDRPVLDAVVRGIDELPRTGSYVDAADIAMTTGLTIEEVAAALNALDGDHITVVRPLALASWYATKVTPEARRTVGQWPTAESLVERLASGITQAADKEPDTERKRRLLAVARELGGAVKSVAINVASEMLDHRLPH